MDRDDDDKAQRAREKDARERADMTRAIKADLNIALADAAARPHAHRDDLAMRVYNDANGVESSSDESEWSADKRPRRRAELVAAAAKPIASPRADGFESAALSVDSREVIDILDDVVPETPPAGQPFKDATTIWRDHDYPVVKKHWDNRNGGRAVHGTLMPKQKNHEQALEQCKLYINMMKEKIVSGDYGISSIAMQIEIAPSTKQPHIQWAATAERRLGYAKWELALDARSFGVNINNSHKPQAAADYCQKDESCYDPTYRYVYGAPHKGQGERTDLEAVHKTIFGGGSLEDVARINPAYFVRSHAGLQALMEVARVAALKKSGADGVKITRDVYVFWGDAGTGKSRLAAHLTTLFQGFAATQLAFTKGATWFNGHMVGTACAILNDFDGASCGFPISTFKHITDVYPAQVPIKGGFISWDSVRIVFITSNRHPRDWYDFKTEADRAAILRRIKLMWCVSTRDVCAHTHTRLDLQAFQARCRQLEPR